MASNDEIGEVRKLHSKSVIWARDADLEERIREHGKKTPGLWSLLFLCYSTLGVVYGDIGTSPMYVYASTFPDGAPSDEKAVLGTFSMIFWTITVIVLIKYVMIMLMADNNGEGGIIALYSLITRAAKVRTLGAGPQHTSADVGLTGLSNSDEGGRPPTKLSTALRDGLRGSKRHQLSLLVLVLVAINLIISDGVLTPAISVISAVEGIQNNTSLSNDQVVGITVGILIALFMLQSFGTHRISFLFSPIILVWFIANAAIGVINITKYNSSVFKGLSPHYIYYFWSGDSYEAWKRLGSVMLSITGAEALYADLGHFSARSIQLTFSVLVYPALTLTYLGQTAMLMEKPELAPTAFWSAIPDSVYWPMVICATMAAIIASQALITGCFSIAYQGISMAFVPRLQIRHTSSHHMGQIYMPSINYALLVGCVIVVVAFQTSTKIGLAYGLAIISVMVIDTFFLTMVMAMYWNWSWVTCGTFLSIYTFISCAYLSSCLEKIPKGAWFSLVVATALTLVTYIYHYGQQIKAGYFRKAKVPLKFLIEPCDDDTSSPQGGAAYNPQYEAANTRSGAPTRGASPALHHRPGVKLAEDLQNLRLAGTKLPVARVPGIGIYYSELLHGVPPVLVHFMTLTPVLHEVAIFLTVRRVPVPEVHPSERLLIRKLKFKGMFQVITRYGYLEEVEHDGEFIKTVVTELIEYLYPDSRLEEDDDGSSTYDHTNDNTVMSISQISGFNEPLTVVDMDPTISLSSTLGRSLLKRVSTQRASIQQQLQKAGSRAGSVTGTNPSKPGGGAGGSFFARNSISRTSEVSITSDGGAVERVGSPTRGESSRARVMVAFPPLDEFTPGVSKQEGFHQEEDTDLGAAPWVQQPSMLRRVRNEALSKLPSNTGKTLVDSVTTMPLPPPPPRPTISRLSRLSVPLEVQLTASTSLKKEGVVSNKGSGHVVIDMDGLAPRFGSGDGVSFAPQRAAGTALAGEEKEKVPPSEASSVSEPATLLVRGPDAASLASRLKSLTTQTSSLLPASEHEGGFDPTSEQQLLLTAYGHGVVYLLGRSSVMVDTSKGWSHKIKEFVVNTCFNAIVNNTRPAVSRYTVPIESLLEMKMVYKVHGD